VGKNLPALQCLHGLRNPIFPKKSNFLGIRFFGHLGHGLRNPIFPKEYLKSTLSVLLESYMREKGIRHYRRGSFTLMTDGETSGEPDESYCIGSDKEVPDIVLEIIITTGSINKLDVYRPKGVPEVWFLKSDQLRVFHLKGNNYQEITRSEFLPELDLETLLRYTQYQDQYDAVQAFVNTIREQNK
jgi:hypothetical protein